MYYTPFTRSSNHQANIEQTYRTSSSNQLNRVKGVFPRSITHSIIGPLDRWRVAARPLDITITGHVPASICTEPDFDLHAAARRIHIEDDLADASSPACHLIRSFTCSVVDRQNTQMKCFECRNPYPITCKV